MTPRLLVLLGLRLSLAAAVASFKSGGYQRRHREVSAVPLTSVAPVDAALADATASAEAIAAAAEKEAEQRDADLEPATDSSEKKLLLTSKSVVEKDHSSATAVVNASEDVGGGDEYTAEDSDDDSAENSAEVTTTPAPEAGDELESLTPAGKVAKSRALLQDNLRQQAEIAAGIAELGNDTTFLSRVDAEAGLVANQTSAKTLAAVLGSMRKEMRKFAEPFYLEYLRGEQQKLKASELELEANLEGAEVAVDGRVLESRLQPSGLRGVGGEAPVSASIQKVAVAPVPLPAQQSSAAAPCVSVLALLVASASLA